MIGDIKRPIEHRVEVPAAVSDVHRIERELWEFKKHTQEEQVRIMTMMQEREKMWKERLAYLSIIVGMIAGIVLFSIGYIL